MTGWPVRNDPTCPATENTLHDPRDRSQRPGHPGPCRGLRHRHGGQAPPDADRRGGAGGAASGSPPSAPKSISASSSPTPGASRNTSSRPCRSCAGRASAPMWRNGIWGWKSWLKLLWQTMLIAYVGTLLGAVGGFLLCFVAAANLGRSQLAALRRPPLPRILPHRSGDRLRPDLRHRLRPRPAARRARHRHPHHRRAWASSSPRWSRTST